MSGNDKTELAEFDEPLSTLGNGRLEIRSEEVQDIMSMVPHWIVRWGIATILVTTLALLAIAWCVKYPDMVTGRITITTHTPPARVIARTTGHIAGLFVDDKMRVNAGMPLAVLENPANFEHVFALQAQVDSLATLFSSPEKPGTFDLKQSFHLGEIQLAYTTFQKEWNALHRLNSTDFYDNRRQALMKQVAYHETLRERLSNQKQLLLAELALVQSKVEMNRELYEKKLISQNAWNGVEETFLQKKSILEGAESSILNNALQMAEYQSSLIELEHTFEQRREELWASAHTAFRSLESAVADWQRKYLLVAPISGHVSFYDYWSDQQFVNAGDEVMTVVPDEQFLIGKIYLAGRRTGKVEAGQEVRIKLDSYPFAEFGAVNGNVGSISLVARENTELVTVRLPDGLETTYGMNLKFKQGMQGDAAIITAERRVLERILGQLLAVVASSSGS